MQNKNKYNGEVVKKLMATYGVSKRFVHQSLSGDRQSLTSDSIKKEYKGLAEKVENAVENALK